jgi:hypothetical protein
MFRERTRLKVSIVRSIDSVNSMLCIEYRWFINLPTAGASSPRSNVLNWGELPAKYLEPHILRPASSVSYCRVACSDLSTRCFPLVFDLPWSTSAPVRPLRVSRYLSSLAFSINHRASYIGCPVHSWRAVGWSSRFPWPLQATATPCQERVLFLGSCRSNGSLAVLPAVGLTYQGSRSSNPRARFATYQEPKVLHELPELYSDDAVPLL